MIFPAINPYRESLTPTADGTIYADDAIYVRRSDRNCRFLALERTFVNLVLLRGSSDTLLHDASGNHKCLGPQRQRPAVLDLIRPAVDSLGRLVPAASAEDLVALHARVSPETGGCSCHGSPGGRVNHQTLRIGNQTLHRLAHQFSSRPCTAPVLYLTAVAVLRRRYGLERTYPICTRNTGVHRRPDGKGVRCRAAAGDVSLYNVRLAAKFGLRDFIRVPIGDPVRQSFQ
jgi:hypothetical protein